MQDVRNCPPLFSTLLLTNITQADIMVIDITLDDIAVSVNVERDDFMPESQERGALTEAVFYILLSLYKPLHGYGIMQFVREMSHERVILGAGTLYGALNTLVEKGWITAVSEGLGERKKEYVITQVGKQVVNDELLRLTELLQNGFKIAGEGSI